MPRHNRGSINTEPEGVCPSVPAGTRAQSLREGGTLPPAALSRTSMEPDPGYSRLTSQALSALASLSLRVYVCLGSKHQECRVCVCVCVCVCVSTCWRVERRRWAGVTGLGGGAAAAAGLGDSPSSACRARLSPM